MQLEIRFTKPFRVVAGLASVLAFSACSSSDPSPLGSSGGAVGAGGTASGGNPGVLTGGSVAVGGNVAAGGNGVGGNVASVGGTTTGGAALPLSTGGTVTSGTTGGTTSTGGAASYGGSTAKGGGTSSTGGTVNIGGVANNGGAKATGGAAAAGGAVTTGGANAVGGTSTGGMVSTGGKAVGGGSNGGASTGGAANTGGATSTGGSSGSDPACSGADATEYALVKAWLNNTTAVGALPSYAYSNIKSNFPAGAAFDKLACSIAMSCVEFAPTNWLRKCEAVITSAIVAESSYNPASVVNDSYGGTTDPTVGLLQIRFSSTVRDYNYYGPMAKIAAIGCSWPSALLTAANTDTYWKGQGANNLAFMQDVACNIGLATWYYFYNATGNGGSSAVWISNYCAGSGVAGNMVVGLMSHLQGGSYARPADANNAYPWGIECCACGNPSGCTCTGCNGRFAAFMGIGTTSSRPSPDPFQESLAPEVSKYCK